MIPMWTDNPVHDAEQQSEYQERITDLPVCSECGERITDDWYFNYDGTIICPSCNRKHLVWN